MSAWMCTACMEYVTSEYLQLSLSPELVWLDSEIDKVCASSGLRSPTFQGTPIHPIQQYPPMTKQTWDALHMNPPPMPPMPSMPDWQSLFKLPSSSLGGSANATPDHISQFYNSSWPNQYQDWLDRKFIDASENYINEYSMVY